MKWERFLIRSRPKLLCVEASNPPVSISIDYNWGECTVCPCPVKDFQTIKVLVIIFTIGA